MGLNLLKIMKKIYIHIGLPKTGSTSLQKYLKDNRLHLKSVGVNYPFYEDKPNGANGQLIVKELIRLYNEDAPHDIWSEYSEFIFGEQDVSILSAESLSKISADNIITLQKALKKISHEVKIIAFIREPYEHTCSLYFQKNNAHSVLSSFNEFIGNNLIYQFTHLRKWFQIFDKEQIQTIDYGKCDDVIKSFFSFIDRKVVQELVFPNQKIKLNSSYNIIDVTLINAIRSEFLWGGRVPSFDTLGNSLKNREGQRIPLRVSQRVCWQNNKREEFIQYCTPYLEHHKCLKPYDINANIKSIVKKNILESDWADALSVLRSNLPEESYLKLTSYLEKNNVLEKTIRKLLSGYTQPNERHLTLLMGVDDSLCSQIQKKIYSTYSTASINESSVQTEPQLLFDRLNKRIIAEFEHWNSHGHLTPSSIDFVEKNFEAKAASLLLSFNANELKMLSIKSIAQPLLAFWLKVFDKCKIDIRVTIISYDVKQIGVDESYGLLVSLAAFYGNIAKALSGRKVTIISDTTINNETMWLGRWLEFYPLENDTSIKIEEGAVKVPQTDSLLVKEKHAKQAHCFLGKLTRSNKFFSFNDKSFEYESLERYSPSIELNKTMVDKARYLPPVFNFTNVNALNEDHCDLKRKLYLHIGMPKCGSSALQHYWLKNRYFLSKQGISYEKTKRFNQTLDGRFGCGGNSDNLAKKLSPKFFDDKNFFQYYHENFYEFMDEYYQEHHEALISEESFADAESSRISMIESLLLKQNYQIHAFAIVRDILPHTLSRYLQKLRAKKTTLSWGDFLVLECDFQLRCLQSWFEGFKHSKVKVIQYESCQKNIESKVMSDIGLEKVVDIAMPNTIRSNSTKIDAVDVVITRSFFSLNVCSKASRELNDLLVQRKRHKYYGFTVNKQAEAEVKFKIDKLLSSINNKFASHTLNLQLGSLPNSTFDSAMVLNADIEKELNSIKSDIKSHIPKTQFQNQFAELLNVLSEEKSADRLRKNLRRIQGREYADISSA